LSTIIAPGLEPWRARRSFAFFQIVPGFLNLRRLTQRRTAMTKLSLIGVAAVAAYAALTVPTFAQHRTSAYEAYAQAGACPGHEAGNPYNKETDYLGWSAWRDRGGWDASNDFTCAPTRMSHSEY
jgi:hypothetical protein